MLMAMKGSRRALAMVAFSVASLIPSTGSTASLPGAGTIRGVGVQAYCDSGDCLWVLSVNLVGRMQAGTKTWTVKGAQGHGSFSYQWASFLWTIQTTEGNKEVYCTGKHNGDASKPGSEGPTPWIMVLGCRTKTGSTYSIPFTIAMQIVQHVEAPPPEGSPLIYYRFAGIYETVPLALPDA